MESPLQEEVPESLPSPFGSVTGKPPAAMGWPCFVGLPPLIPAPRALTLKKGCPLHAGNFFVNSCLLREQPRSGLGCPCLSLHQPPMKPSAKQADTPRMKCHPQVVWTTQDLRSREHFSNNPPTLPLDIHITSYPQNLPVIITA